MCVRIAGWAWLWEPDLANCRRRLAGAPQPGNARYGRGRSRECEPQSFRSLVRIYCRAQNPFYIGLSVGMADEIECAHVQSRQVISIFVRTRRVANDYRRNFSWLRS